MYDRLLQAVEQYDTDSVHFASNPIMYRIFSTKVTASPGDAKSHWDRTWGPVVGIHTFFTTHHACMRVSKMVLLNVLYGYTYAV